jgi:hypothetical protein
MERLQICRRLAAALALGLLAPAPWAMAQCLLPLPAPQFAIQGAPRKVATGDLNGDGIADIVATQDGKTDAAVLLSAGGGAFHPAIYLPVGGTPYGVAIGNFDGAGGLDVAIAVSNAPKIALFSGNGAGNLTPMPDLVVPQGQRDIAADDVNGDGVDDIAWLGVSDKTVHVYENDGAGGFTFWASAAFAYGPYALTLGDQDGDGFAELVVVEAQGSNPLNGPGNTYYYANLGESAGEWQGFSIVPAITQTAPYPSHVRFAEVNNLPGRELVVSCDSLGANEGRVDVLSNPIGGVFQSVDSYLIGARAPWSAAGDLNGDGFADIAAIGDINTDKVSILLNQGDGTFAAGTPYDVAGNHLFLSIELSDLDDDGDLDCVVGGISGRAVTALVNNGDGSFELPTFVPTTDFPNTIRTIDINKDGSLDMLTSGTGGIYLHRGNGDGTFQAPDVFASLGIWGGTIAADLNDDTWPDLITANASGIITPQINDTVGGFGAGSPTPAIPGLDTIKGVDAEDFNGDSLTDLAVTFYATAHPWNRMRILLNDGLGGYTLGDVRNLGNNAFVVHADDVDGDTDIDLIIQRPYISDGVTVLYNNGAGVFSSQADFSTHIPAINNAAAVSMVTVDLDGDTDIDIVSVNSFDRSVSVLLNNGSGVFATQPPIYFGLRNFGVDAADITGDGIIDLVVGINQGNTVDEQSMYGCALLPGIGAGAFGAPVHFGGSIGPWDVACGDLNDDGRVDVLIAAASSDGVDVLLNNGCLAPPPFCPGDSNGDSMVNFDDITETLANWQADYSPGSGPGDANGDGFVNFDDITEALANWGGAC